MANSKAMKFYDCQTAPSPRRVRFFIAEKGLDIPTIQVDLASGEQFGSGFTDKNHAATVPVLELEDGTCIAESVAICQYLEELHPAPPLLGNDARERALVTMWNSRAEQAGLAAIAESLRNRSKGMVGRALPGPVGYEQIPELVSRGRKRAEVFFEDLDSRLGASEFVATDQFSIADITAFIAVDFAGWIKLFVPDELAHLHRWYKTVAARPAAKV